jgi:hypothetical protein
MDGTARSPSDKYSHQSFGDSDPAETFGGHGYLESEPNSGLQVLQDQSTEKIAVGTHSPLQVLHQDAPEQPGLEVQQPEKKGRKCRLRRRHFFILFAFITIVIVTLAIGLGVGLSQKKSNSSTPPPSPSNSSSPSDPSSTDTPSSPIVTTPFGTAVSENSTLAAVQWVESSGKTVYRIYFLDAHNNIGQLSWIEGATAWTVASVTNSSMIMKVKTGSPLTAIVGFIGNDNTKPPVSQALRGKRRLRLVQKKSLYLYCMQQVNIWFLDISNQIRELFTDTSSPNIWRWGASNLEKWTPSAQSDLAVSIMPPAIYWQSTNNSILAGVFNAASGWSSYALPGTPVQGTAIAPVTVTRNSPNQLYVYYAQNSGAGMPFELHYVNWTQGDSASFSGWSQRKAFPLLLSNLTIPWLLILK